MRTSQAGRGRYLARPVLTRPALALLVLLTAVAGVAAVAGTVPAQAASGPAIGPFGLIPALTAAGNARSYFRLDIGAGRSARDVAVISNEGKATERLRVTVSVGVTAANSGSAYEPPRGRCAGASCWVVGLPHVVTLAPGERKGLVFRVAVPAGTGPGQYLAGITAESAIKPKAVQVGKNGHASARAIIIDQVTVGVAVTVGSPGQLRTALAVSGVSGSWVGLTPRLSIRVRNNGQTFTRARGTAACQVSGQRHSYPVIMSTVLPGGAAVLAVNARGLDTGSLPCTVQLRAAGGTRTTWSGTVNFPKRVLTKTYHPAKGVYVPVPQSTTPTWAIVLLALGGLILVALLVLLALILRRRHRQPSPAGAPRLDISDLGRPQPNRDGPGF
jgi:hypothetical protein